MAGAYGEEHLRGVGGASRRHLTLILPRGGTNQAGKPVFQGLLLQLVGYGSRRFD